MAKKIEPSGLSGKFYSVAKVGHLLFTAIEVTIENGKVVSQRRLNKAPDLAATCVGKCSAGIWDASRLQTITEEERSALADI